MQSSPIEPIHEIDFKLVGGVADGQTPNDDLIRELINQNTDHPFVLFFPAGTYHFSQSIDLPSNCILRGKSADSTILQFRLEEEDHLIKVQGNASIDTSYFAASANKDDSFIRVREAERFQVGDYIKLLEQDSAWITSPWALHSTGQLVQIKSMLKDSLFLDQPLRRDYSLINEPRIVRFEPKTQVGIEQVQILRLDKTVNQTSNLYFEYAANCWVSCVESRFCNFAHVELNHSLQIEIKGSHFEQAHDYGGGGKAYGVMLHFSSGSSLIHDNSFKRLRHAMILQAGANGNVLAYNYSVEPYWTDVNLPYDSAGDLVLHGNYPYANLFEGNVVQNIVIDNSHGINGPFNTFFRNRAELYGIFMNQEPSSAWQNFLGNEVPNQGLFLGNYILAGEGHFEFANNIRGNFRPEGNHHLVEKSLFLLHEPLRISQPLNLPPIGPPNAINTYQIGAQKRFEVQLSTACASPLVSTELDPSANDPKTYYLQSDPSQNLISLHQRNKARPISQLSVYSIQGELIQTSQSASLTLYHLPYGLYIIKFQHANGESGSLKWKKDW